METPKNRITTRDFAQRFGVLPDSVRRSLCTKGHFLGFRPLKLQNSRLLWPDVHPEDANNREG